LKTLRQQKPTYSNIKRVDERLKERKEATEKPVYVGLMAPNMAGGVFINEAPFVTYEDTDREKLLDFLAAKLYAGGGHTQFFQKQLERG
jgi:hypothetical protein